MQTFLPFPSFEESAAVLDPLRLGKQRVEALQVVRAVVVPDYGWRHHPVAKMWSGYPASLVRYGLAVCAAWDELGRADTVAAQLRTYEFDESGDPWWLGDESFHRSHRSNLTRKDPEWYGRFWDEPADLPYRWPGPTREVGWRDGPSVHGPSAGG